MRPQSLRAIHRLLLAVILLALGAFLFKAAGWSGDQWGELVLVTLWVGLPHLLIFSFARRRATKPRWQVAWTLANVCLAALNYYIYSTGLAADAQGALLLIFVPVWEMLALIALRVLAGLLALMRRKPV